MVQIENKQSVQALSLKDTIIHILDEDAQNEEYILKRISELKHEDSQETGTYSTLLQILSSLEFPEDEAKTIWEEILDHKNTISSALERPISFRVAMLDYFIRINQKLNNPKLIEIRVYTDTEKLVLIDELTKLFNRRHFHHSLEREFKQSQRHGAPFSVLILDIDDFKQINDTHGHTSGDEVLKLVANTLKQNIRTEDTVCRIGGEEFAILLPHTGEENAQIVAEKLLEQVRKIYFKDRKITISCGLVTYPKQGTFAEELYDMADKALYYSKFTGKNKVSIYSQDKRASMRVPSRMELFLRLPDLTFKSISKDISLTGIGFETEHPIEISEVLDIQLREAISGQWIDAKIRIVRKEKRDASSFHIGAEFIDLSDKDKFILQSLTLGKKNKSVLL
ncbi:diguanylate cyclase (GGDEF) domain protein [Leptospira ryugenii]|uniref:diguanylate cyclase n=1 Tax=Leptospira ryugenii TaxID=1917863 RepID=A0A2P2DYJ7_9LEPT|nr:diguanylate cyclase [Leptospira ryugenii]GBF49670.1 diguanylate cyclase (GGDEF) domain protein [Leptospira ryugenii]